MVTGETVHGIGKALVGPPGAVHRFTRILEIEAPLANCSICSNAPARALIDGALLTGMTPRDVHRYHADALGVSLSAVYRHARAHRPHTMMASSWLGDSLSGEIVADLAALRRSYVEQRDAALARGDAATASREGHEALSASSALLKAGFSDDEAAEQLGYLQKILRSVQRAARDRPAHAQEIAAAARQLEYADVAADADDLAHAAITYNESTKGSTR